MTIVTFVKHVPDAEARLRAGPGGLDLEGAGFALDGMDEYGVEQALRLKEAGLADEVVALALGPARVEAALRSALALGADRAVLLETDADLDPIAQAPALAAAVREAGARLVLVGGKQADWDSAALGPALAEALGWPLLDWATELAIEGGDAVAVHDADDGSAAWRAPLPVVATTQQGLNEPRYPTLPNIMKAKRKPLERRALGAAASTVATVRVELPSRARRGVILDGDVGVAGRRLADALGAPLAGLVLGDAADADAGAAALAGFVPTLYRVADPALAHGGHEARTRAVADVARSFGARAVLMSANRSGQAVAPRVALRLGGALLEDVTEVRVDGGALVAERLTYLSRAVATVRAIVEPVVVTVKPGAYPVADRAAADGAVESVAVAFEPGDTAATVQPAARAVRERVALEEADVVVCGGRGLGDAAAFEAHAVGLADDLGGAIAATRAVVDAGWRPYGEQVGQTGKSVAPKLYVGLALSGAVQHLSGMNRSGVIVAVNKDADAPIFKVADYGIVGDVHAVVPALRDALKALD
jgi:electron transfer flavoprotein alpha subunit